MILAPWVILAVPSEVFRGLGILLVMAVTGVGLAGMLGRIPSLATLSSIALLGLLIAGNVGTDLEGLPFQDTAVLMLEFVTVIFFMEASRVVLSYEKETIEMSQRTDESSQLVRAKLVAWVRGQLSRQAKLTIGALALSLFLLVLGGLTSISISQVAFSASLVLVVVGVLVFLVTQRREPIRRERF